jgi:hypothetical protein
MISKLRSYAIRGWRTAWQRLKAAARVAVGRRPSARYLSARQSGFGRRFARLEMLEGRAVLAAQPVISELLAINTAGHQDEDGHYSSWIELSNVGDEAADLAGWSLTDDSTHASRWSFPSVILPAQSHLVVFGSGKNRAGPKLHTSFVLDAADTYLALLDPGGVASTQFDPLPQPHPNASFGGVTVETVRTQALVTAGAEGRFLVPGDDGLGFSWIGREFNDSAWTQVTTGVGYETDAVVPPPAVDCNTATPPATCLARSVHEFSNLQHPLFSTANNWDYGYWRKNLDFDGVYQPTEFRRFIRTGGSTLHTLNNWNGSYWELATDPARPNTELRADGGKPEAQPTAGAEIHAVIRRWHAEATAPIRIQGTISDLDNSGTGAVARILVEGEAIYSTPVNGNTINYTVYHSATAGERIDFVIDAGPDNDDAGDNTLFTAFIDGLAVPLEDLTRQIATDVQVAMKGVNASAYLRIPFNNRAPAPLNSLKLRMKYDAGFIAYVNGFAISANAPSDVTYNTQAARERPDTEAMVFEDFDLTEYSFIIAAGANILAIHGLNSAAGDPDFLLLPELHGEYVHRSFGELQYFTQPSPGLWNYTSQDDFKVVITEFMSRNTKTLRDQHGEYSDWIEIHNPGLNTVDLEGWSLTDDPFNLRKWDFPNFSMPPNSFRVVFASGRGHSQAHPYGHTDFRLGSDEQLMLVGPDDLIYSSFATSLQLEDVSFGIGRGSGIVGYMVTPTPGGENSDSVDGFLAPPTITPSCAVTTPFVDLSCSGPITVGLAAPDPAATLYYTTDGSAPGPTNPAAQQYVAPLDISNTTSLRAMAFRQGYYPSAIVGQNFAFLDSVAGQDVMDVDVVGPDDKFRGRYAAAIEQSLTALPSVFLTIAEEDLYGDSGIYTNFNQRGNAWERSINVQYAIPEGLLERRDYDPQWLADINRDGSINLRDLAVIQQNLGLAGGAMRATGDISGDGRVDRSDVVRFLNAPRPDLVYPPSNVPCHIYVSATCPGFNIGAGLRIDGAGEPALGKKSLRLVFSSDYGPGKLTFRLFPDSPAIEFDRLALVAAAHDSWQSPFVGEATAATFLRDEFVRRSALAMGMAAPRGRFVHLYLNGTYWGVYNLVEKIDETFADTYLVENAGCLDPLGCYDIIKNGAGGLSEVEVGDRTVWDQVIQLAGQGVTTDAAYDNIGRLVDIDNLIDYMLLNFYVGATDWLPDHWSAVRPRTLAPFTSTPVGRFIFLPGDSEKSLGKLRDDVTAVDAADSPGYLFAQLQANERFRLRIADRVHRHLTGGGALTPAAAVERWNELAAQLREALPAEAARWGDERREVPYTPDEFWEPQVQSLVDLYFPNRSQVVIGQLQAKGLLPTVERPTFSSPGGAITGPITLAMFSSSGNIFYTLDGSDPRLPGGVTVAALSYAFTGPVTITGDTLVRAAVFDPGLGVWSPLVEEYYSLLASSLRVTEIMFNPEGNDGDFEYIEIANIHSTLPINLAGVSFTEGIDAVFGTTLGPGKRAVIARDREAFRFRYGGTAFSSVVGEYQGALANDGDHLILKVRKGAIEFTLLDFFYDPNWHPDANGDGPSLVIADPTIDPAFWSDADAWVTSADGGTPGIADPIIEIEEPPLAPTGLTAVLTANREVLLTWEPPDAEIDLYYVYRNGVRIATTGSLFYSDVQHFGQATYEVSAISRLGLEGGRTTPIGVRSLEVTSVTVVDEAHVRVNFNAPVEATTAGAITNYVIGGVQVVEALLETSSQILLTTSQRETGRPYRLFVSNVKGTDGTTIYDEPEGKRFTSLAQFGLLGTYYDSPAVSFDNPATSGVVEPAPDMPFGDKVGERVDPIIEFVWLARPTGIFTPPLPETANDTFGVRWTGQLLPPVSGDYTFSFATNPFDGVRFWIDTDEDGQFEDIASEQLVNIWRTSSSTQTASPITLDGGKLYEIRIDGYDDQSNFRLRFNWQHPNQSVPALVPSTNLFLPGAELPPPRENPPPRAMDAQLGSTKWSSQLTDRLGAAGASFPLDQSATPIVPWTDIDQVSVVFNEDVLVGVEDLQISGLNAAEHLVRSFRYDPARLTATWTLRQPIAAEEITVAVSPNVIDLEGQPLVGATTTRFGILPGDVTSDAAVDRDDLTAVLRGEFHRIGDAGYSAIYDVDGSGTITVRDAVQVRNRIGETLPAGRIEISEFLANNRNGQTDDEGNKSDWIEIYNADSTPANLSDWYLTDDAQNLTRWRLPAVVLQPGERLVVFASGKDRPIPGQPLHTSFALATEGGYLALVRPDGQTVASAYADFPQQHPDVSYGRNSVDGRDRYFAEPTPGEVNRPENLVRITEFMADNHNLDLVEFGGEPEDYPDWVELYNDGTTAEHLSDWALVSDGTRWELPPVNLAPGAYLIVFATGDAPNPLKPLYANFKLSAGGEDLTLVRPDGERMTEYGAYPPQRAGVSFGLSLDFNQHRFFSVPTPGAANSTGSDAVLFSVPHGFYDTPFYVQLSSELPGAAIYYTTDGSEPSSDHGTEYDLDHGAPLWIDRTTLVRAVAIIGGSARQISTQTYVFLDGVPTQGDNPDLPNTWGVQANYGMDEEILNSAVWNNDVLRSLPSLSLVLDRDDLFSVDEHGIYAFPHMEGPEWERPGSLEWLDPASGAAGFSANGMVRIAGRPHTRVSEHMVAQPKLSFAVTFDDPVPLGEAGDPLFTHSPAKKASSLYLRAGYEDSWTSNHYYQIVQALYGRDEWMRQSQRAMGQPSVDGRFVHLYLNGLYWGVYNVTEEPSATFAAEHFGGDPTTYDVVAGGADGVQPIAGTIDQWSNVAQLVNADLSDPAAYDDLAAIVDIDNLIDYLILDLYAYAGDTDYSITTKDPRQGWFAVRRQADGEKFRFFAWDNEVVLGLGDEDYLSDRAASGTATPTAGNPAALDPYVMLDSLRHNSQFVQRFADRTHAHLSQGGALSEHAAADRWADFGQPLANPLVAEAARWGRHRRDIDGWETPPTCEPDQDPDEDDCLDPDDAANPPQPPEPRDDEEDRLFEELFPERRGVLLGYFQDAGLAPSLAPPTYSLQNVPGSSGEPNTDTTYLVLSAPAGTIYYTLDGPDPRATDGSVVAAAQPYTTPKLIVRNSIVRARAYSGGQWSALTEARLVLDDPLPLRITEVMYHPAAPSPASLFTDDDFEFLELKNVGDEEINLTGARFSEGIDFAFDDGEVTTLGAGEYVLVVKNRAAFESRYGAGRPIAGEYGGLLNNGGDDVRLIDDFGQTIQLFSYDDLWAPVTDGAGFSLVMRDERTIPSSLPAVGQWESYIAASLFGGGSPGTAESPLPPGAVVINEVFAGADETDARGDWIELLNTTQNEIDVSGWFLSDSESELQKFVIPDSPSRIIIAPGGYVVFYEHGDELGHAPLEFGLKQGGDEVYLSSGDGSNFGGYRQQIAFGAATAGISIGRHVTSDGEVDLSPLTVPTPATANSRPSIGPIVINEFMYAPVTAAATANGVEYIELHNAGDRQISLDNWSLDGVNYRFPDVSIPAGGFVLVVGVDPDAFRAAYGDVPGVAVVGPYDGGLDNGGERISLYADSGMLIDHVNYDNETPWPMLADEFGASLERRSAWAYGNESQNWKASHQGGTPGRSNAISPPPRPTGYSQDFQSGDLYQLPGWTFSVTNPPAITTGGVEHPSVWIANGSELVARQSVYGIAAQEAVLAVDLTGLMPEADLALDFRMKLDRDSDSGSDFVQLFVSGDGNAWTAVGERLAPVHRQYVRYVLDLKRELADAQIALDGDVYIKFRHEGGSPGDGMSLDDVQVVATDLIGPTVVAYAPATVQPGSFSSFTITFSEEINSDTFGTADVSITGPVGNQIDPTMLRPAADNRTWTIEFERQSIPGTYTFSVGPDIRDLAGIGMGSASIIAGGVAVGDATFTGTILVPPTAARVGAYTETFAEANFDTLVGWSFAVTGAGAFEWAQNSGAPAGLVATQSAHVLSTQDAILMLDLSNLTNPGLEFELTRLLSDDEKAQSVVVLYASDDGAAWQRVYGLDSPPDVPQRYRFDLTTLGLSLGDDVYLRFSHEGTTVGDGMALRDLRIIGDSNSAGPYVASHSPTGPGLVVGPVTQLQFDFGESDVAGTFGLDDIAIIDPMGGTIVPTGSLSHDSDDGFWTIELGQPLTLAGLYQLVVGPMVSDASGSLMNQDRDPIAGELLDDAYRASFTIGPPPAQPVPYHRTFNDAHPSQLAGWSVSVDPGSRWELTDSLNPRGGDGFHFVASQTENGVSVQEAALLLDIGSGTSSEGLSLDFWAQHLGPSGPSHVTRLFLSDDGQEWHWFGSLNPPAGAYLHYAFDLDLLLDQSGIESDGNPIYLKFQHQGVSAGSALTLDDVRVGPEDVFGPQIIASSQVSQQNGVGSLQVTFDRPMKSSTFTAQDVTIYVGQKDLGWKIPASSVETADEQTFTISFDAPSVGGEYTLEIGADITDRTGIPLDHTRDAVAGNPAGDDGYSTTFPIVPPAQRVLPGVPYTQGFEASEIGSFENLAGWTLSVMGDFEYGANTWEQSGGHLIATQAWDCWTDHDAILKLDLQGVGQDDELELEFWMQFAERGTPNIEDRRSARVLVRGEESSDWIDISGTLIPPEGEYTQYTFDLGAILTDQGIRRDDDVYIKLNRRGFHKRSPVTFDNVTVRAWAAASPVAAVSQPALAAAPPASGQTSTQARPHASERRLAAQSRRERPVLTGQRPSPGGSDGSEAGAPRRPLSAARRVVAAHDHVITYGWDDD